MNKSLLLHRKRPRLEVQSSQSNNVEAINDLWGEEICLNFDQIQEIETQALSQINIQVLLTKVKIFSCKILV